MVTGYFVVDDSGVLVKDVSLVGVYCREVSSRVLDFDVEHSGVITHSLMGVVSGQVGVGLT